MRSLFYYSFVFILLIGYSAITGFTTLIEEEPKVTNKNIIKFSHEFHSEVTDCAACHSGATSAMSLTDRLLPGKSDCAACHDVDDDENCGLCHYEDNFEPLVQSGSSLFFNHAQHVETLEMECTTCHKGLDKVEYSFESAGVSPSMALCYDCHNDQSVATNNCVVCHKGTADLIPADHKLVNFFGEHKFTALNDKSCAMCHDNTFCEACHVSTTAIDGTNTATDFYTPYSPHQYKSDAKQMQIARVHSFDFRYSHGIEAKGKISDCQTCHQTETFCAECHSSNGGDYAAEGFLPTSHLVSDFFTVGVGSGGGQHAILARRDIENCAACHDTQGADPSCILCHMDNDGVRGTNPRTHESGFMSSNEHGDWHDDMGSVCYNCHTDINARPSGQPGVGFCGYCHGSN